MADVKIKESDLPVAGAVPDGNYVRVLINGTSQKILVENMPSSGGDMILATAQTVTGAKTRTKTTIK